MLHLRDLGSTCRSINCTLDQEVASFDCVSPDWVVLAMDMEKMGDMVQVYAEGDALEYEIIASSADRFDMNVNNCRYAEMMQELGGRDFGHLLVCDADFISAKQLGLSLSRTQTCMQGATYCDFRYRPLAGD